MEDPTRKLENKVVIDGLCSSDPEMRKEAAEGLNDYIRVKSREQGLTRKLVPPDTILPEDLDRQYGFEEPVKIFEKEPDSANAVTVPFGHEPEARELEGDTYMVVFDKIQTVKHIKDKNLLLTYENDIRQIVTDNDLNEILEHEDRRLFATIDSMLSGGSGVAEVTISAAGTDVALWKNISGGFTPNTWKSAMQIMPKADARFVPSTVVMNMVTAMEFEAWDAFDLGMTLKEEVVANGFGEMKFNGRRIIITIKRDLVGDNELYMFAEPNKLGRFCILDDVTIYPEAKGSEIEWYAEECVGLSLAQITGVANATRA